MDKVIPLPNGLSVLVSEEDYEFLSAYKWRILARKYVATDIDRKPVYMHRLIMCAASGQIIDHKNTNTFDNRRSNLRFCKRNESQRNRNRAKRKIGSRYKGVYKAPGGKFRARVRDGTKDLFSHTFCTEELAAKAYNDAAKNFFGDFAQLNNIA